MRVLIDISLEDAAQKTPFLFNVNFCKHLIERYIHVHWIFIANPAQIQSGNLKGASVINSEWKLKKAPFLQYFYQKALRKKAWLAQPQYIISSGVHLPKSFNLFLIHTHSQLLTLPSKHLHKYQLVIAASPELKQSLIEKLKIDETKIKLLPAYGRMDFIPLNDEAAQQIRNEMANGHQYFLFNSAVTSASQIKQLLKAFSFFKKRLQSGMKLVLNIHQTQELLTLLETYKYKSDVVCIQEAATAKLAAVTAAAYACIQYATNDSPLLPQEIQQCGVPVIMLQPTGYHQQTGIYVYANEAETDDIAHQLMLLYKDETYRRTIVQNASAHISTCNIDVTSSALLSFLNN